MDGGITPFIELLYLIDNLNATKQMQAMNHVHLGCYTMIADLDQTLAPIELSILMNLGPTVLPRPFIQDATISRPMTYLLAHYQYVCLFSVLAQ